MNPEPARDVVVVVAARGATAAADRAELAAAAAWMLGVDPREVRVERRCPHCDGRDHGRPLVARAPNVPAGSSAAARAAALPLHVSLSRAGGSVAVALTFLGPVGVDIESVADVSCSGFDAVAFGPAERAALAAMPTAEADDARARLWTAKEAALKCTGDGLRVDPRDLSVSLPRGVVRAELCLEAWRGAGFPVDTIRLRGFEPGRGLAGTVAVLAEHGFAAGGPTVRVVPAARIRQHPNVSA